MGWGSSWFSVRKRWNAIYFSGVRFCLKKFTYFGVGALSTAMLDLCSVVMKRVEPKGKTLCFLDDLCSYAHLCSWSVGTNWVVTETMRSWIQVDVQQFGDTQSRDTACAHFKEPVGGSSIWWGCPPPLLKPPSSGVPGMTNQENAPGQTGRPRTGWRDYVSQLPLDGLCIALEEVTEGGPGISA